jgi:hypothetical protein
MKTWKILLLVGMICLVGFGIFPLNKSIEGLEIKNQKLSDKKEQKTEELKELMGAQKTGKGMVDPEVEIPAKLLQTELILDLKEIASKTGIILPKNWNFSIKYDSDLEVSVLALSFSIKNHRGNIYKFLQLLEQNPRLLGVDGLRIQTIYKGKEKLSEIVINLYAFSQEKLNE